MARNTYGGWSGASRYSYPRFDLHSRTSAYSRFTPVDRAHTSTYGGHGVLVPIRDVKARNSYPAGQVPQLRHSLYGTWHGQEWQPESPKAMRAPLNIPVGKAICGTDMGDGRWLCTKCCRANKDARKVCGREDCGGIAPFNRNHVVLDCANIGCRFGGEHVPANERRQLKFNWQGVRAALEHYHALGLTVSLVVKENWIVPIPSDLEPHACTVPRVDGDKENDDYFVLKLAYEKNCFYVTNDNFRNWHKDLDAMMGIWLLRTRQDLHVSYLFTNQGQFIPRKEATLDWTDGDDSPTPSPYSPAKFPSDASTTSPQDSSPGMPSDVSSPGRESPVSVPDVTSGSTMARHAEATSALGQFPTYFSASTQETDASGSPGGSASPRQEPIDLTS